MLRQSLIEDTPERSNVARFMKLMGFSFVATLAATALIAGLNHRSPAKPAGGLMTANAAISIPDAEGVDPFMQSVAMSHVAPPRTLDEASLLAERKAEASQTKPRPVVKSASKPIEVAVLPPTRPAGSTISTATPAVVAPEPEQKRKLDILGLEIPVPSLPNVQKLFPSQKQVRQKASDLVETVASWSPFR